MRIALAQYDFPVGDITGNVRRIQTLIEQARDAHGADLIVFPELCVSCYSPEDLLFRPQFLAECDTAVRAIAHSTQGIVAVVGWPEAAGSVVYNAASVIRDGRIETTYRKRDLPNHAVFDERRYFETDPDGGVCVFQVGPVPIGLLICQDLWGLEPMAETTAAGARLVLVPNASPFERHKHAERDALLAERARDNGTAIAYVNVVGGQDSTVFDGASLLADARGAVAPAATAFEEHLLITDFDPELQTFTPIAWPRSADESEDGLMYQALVIGTRDYCKKNGFDKVILGLSGGIDSSLVLAIAADALGGSNVTAVRMPSRYTAELSNHLASAQCEALGVPMLTLPIETPFQAYLDTLAPVFKGAAIDITEENLQARIRGAMLMALSNKLGGLVLTTGNKSEYAVGYATVYGDMVGGYAPLKDVYKTEVYRLAHWRNTVGPLAIPQGVIQRAPSAELRPDQKDQTHYRPMMSWTRCSSGTSIRNSRAPRSSLPVLTSSSSTRSCDWFASRSGNGSRLPLDPRSVDAHLGANGDTRSPMVSATDGRSTGGSRLCRRHSTAEMRRRDWRAPRARVPTGHRTLRTTGPSRAPSAIADNLRRL